MKNICTLLVAVWICIASFASPALAKGSAWGGAGGRGATTFGPTNAPHEHAREYGEREPFPFRYWWNNDWYRNWGYLPCYNGGSPYLCDTPHWSPPPPRYIYQGGTVVREYGHATAPDRAPPIINEIKSSPSNSLTY